MNAGTLHLMQALLIYALLTLLVDCVLFARFLDMPRPRLFVRLALITVLSLLVALVGSLIQFLYGDWLFIHSWGTRDLFLATTAIRLPFAFVALPRMEFPKFFSLVTLGNFIGTVLFTLLIWQMPAVIGLGPQTMRELETAAIANGSEIRAAIEKFRINHNGEVPAYLYGGDAVSWRGIVYGPDRLLQEGLLEQYPRNPLHLHRAYMPGRQVWTLPGLFLGTKTPEFTRVRDAWLPVIRREGEPRFGVQGVRMGNLVQHDGGADAYLRRTALPEGVEVPLPGGFLYQSFEDGNGKPAGYVLAVVGAETTAGLDIGTEYLFALPTPPTWSAWETKRDGIPDQVLWVTYGGFLADQISPNTQTYDYP